MGKVGSSFILILVVLGVLAWINRAELGLVETPPQLTDQDVARGASEAGISQDEYRSIVAKLPKIHAACVEAAKKAAKYGTKSSDSDTLYSWGVGREGSDNGVTVFLTGHDLLFQNAFGTWPNSGSYNCTYFVGLHPDGPLTVLVGEIQ